MRILSLGSPMPGPSVDNHNFAGAPSFFDYDAIIVDPRALSQLIEEIVDGCETYTTRSGDHVVNGASGPGAIGLCDLLRARREETARLLARGGLVVCFAYPNVVHKRVAELEDCDRYWWLPPPDGLRYTEPFMRRGVGSRIEVTTKSHPFAPFLMQFASRLAYHAYFEDEWGGGVLARSVGGAAVALQLCLGEGCVIFLPSPLRPPADDERYEFSRGLQEAVRQTLRSASASGAPHWLSEYALPGLAERLAARSEAERQLVEAQSMVGRAEAAVDELESYRRLLWQEGRYGLEEGVRAACGLLGFTVTTDIDEPAQISLTDDRLRQRTAMLEVDASEQAVGLEGHYRLRQRLEEAIAQGKQARGVLIINGYRRTTPAERPAQYDEALRVAAERLRYGVATTTQLFHVVRAALEGNNARVTAFRERLLKTEGVLEEGEDRE